MRVVPVTVVIVLSVAIVLARGVSTFRAVCMLVISVGLDVISLMNMLAVAVMVMTIVVVVFVVSMIFGKMATVCTMDVFVVTVSAVVGFGDKG